MKARELKEKIYWVGAIDWNLRNFHGYLTQRGSTYNAYLIIDEKITLIDTVKAYLEDELLKRISDIIDPSKIDYIISNHVEMDHSGALPKILDLNPDAGVLTSPKGITGLKSHFKKDWNFKVVNTGDTLNIGKRNLQFILTPMVHWPDNMITYVPEEKILFSNDSMGQHYASSERFDDECPIDIIMDEAKKYYANIVLPYSKQVQKEYNTISPLNIELIAASHGIIWRKYVKEIIEEYKKWSSNVTIKKAVIVYDTMWKSTEMIAYAIQEAFEEMNYSTSMLNLQLNHISDIMTELIDAEYICVGSPTLNKNMLPSVAGFLTYMKGLAPANRKAIAFGSYGWDGGSIPQIVGYLTNSGFIIVDEIKKQYIPGQDDLNEIIKSLKEKIT